MSGKFKPEQVVSFTGICTHNIHGIDIDLRAAQLSALSLYLKAKTLSSKVRLSESRLACANVHMPDGDNLRQFVGQAKLGPIYRRILTALQARLKDSDQLGSLLRLEEEIRELIEEERKRYEREGKAPDLFRWYQEQFEAEAGKHEFWETLEIQISQALDAFVRDHATGSEQVFFAGETIKGLRLLELTAQRYEVVVTNPPYMTSRNMNSTLKKLLQEEYPIAKSDLYASFIQRCTFKSATWPDCPFPALPATRYQTSWIKRLLLPGPTARRMRLPGISSHPWIGETVFPGWRNAMLASPRSRGKLTQRSIVSTASQKRTAPLPWPTGGKTYAK